jgi:hypothetical protein
MSHKQHPQNNPAADTHKKTSEKENTNRHVYIEPGVQIDFVKDFRQEYTSSQKHSTTQGKKILFWTKASAILLFVYATLTGMQDYFTWTIANTGRKQMIASVRPWIGLDDGHNALTAGNLTFDSFSQPHLAAYALSLKNYSPYPAQNVFQASFLVLTGDLKVADDAMRLACKTYVTNPDINYVIFQGQNRVVDGLIMPYAGNVKTGTVEAHVAGCIGYRDQFGILYRSGFEFDFRPINQFQKTITIDLSEDIRDKSILGQWYLSYSNLDPGTEDRKISNRP